MITVHSYRLSDVTIYSSKWTQLHRSKPILGVTFSGLWTICISTLVKLSQLMLILLLSWLNRFQSSAEAIRGNLWKSHDALKDRWGINLKLTAANAFFHANSSLKKDFNVLFLMHPLLMRLYSWTFLLWKRFFGPFHGLCCFEMKAIFSIWSSSLFVFSINCLKQNATSLLTSGSDTDFYALLCGSMHFVLPGSSNNRLFHKESECFFYQKGQWLKKLP